MCTPCRECVRRCVRQCQCNVHTCPCTSAYNTCKVHAPLPAKKMHTYTYTHTYAYAYTSTRIPMRILDNVQTR